MNNPGVGCNRTDRCIFCKGVADTRLMSEPDSELAENLLLKLGVEWAKEFGDTAPNDPQHGFALVAMLLVDKKDLRKAMSYYGFIQMTYLQLQAKIEAKQLGAISIEIRQQMIQDLYYF